MCGFVGAFHPNPSYVTQSAELVAMRDSMVHRGPDDAGLHRSTDGRCHLGFRRLSIIDLSDSASQPMVNDAGDVVLVFNGEIYNHREIRQTLEECGGFDWKTDHSDTEVLLRAYERWGIDCLDRLNGMFSFAIYDSRNPSKPVLHIARDRLGIKPMYFSRTSQGEWLFASEIRALMAHRNVSPDMNRAAFWHYLTFIVSPPPLTLFRGVFKLPAGHRIEIDHQGAARAKRYWDSRPAAKDTLRESDLSLEEAASEVIRLLGAAVNRQMVSDVPWGVLLSGGVDSSLNVALMSEITGKPVSTFTVGYETHEELNEFQHAERIAQRYGTNHHTTRIDYAQALEFLPNLVRLQDEPIADNVCIPLYFLAKLVRDSGTTVVQVGEGADENFLGYWWCDHYREKFETVYEPARKKARSFWGRFGRMVEDLTLSEEDAEFRRRGQAGEELFWGGATCWTGAMRDKLTPDRVPFADDTDCPVTGLDSQFHARLDSHAIVKSQLKGLPRLSKPEVLQKIPYLEKNLRLSEHLLMRVDKMTMAHSVEARVPFLDHELVEFATRLPTQYKLRDGIGKLVLKKGAEPYIDDDLLYRRKQGFGAPMEQWFKEGDFGPRCLAAYKRSPLRTEGFFDDDYLLGMMEHQMGSEGGYSFHLWTVLNAVLWHAYWIEGREDCL